jgi:hypothetical protein
VLTVLRKLKHKKITDLPHIYSSNSAHYADMGLGFDEAFQYIVKTAEYDYFSNGVELN